MTVLFSLIRSISYQRIMNHVATFSLLMSVLILSACGGGVAGNDKNFIVVKDQTVTHLNEITIESVVVDQNIIAVVYAEKTNEALNEADKNKVLGYSALTAGDYTDIKIQLSRNTQNNETLYIELRSDKGIVGQLEPDTIDRVISQSTISTVSFAVMHASVHLEVVEEPDNPGQYIAPNPERIDIREAIVDSASWLVVHRNVEGAVGDVIGIQSLGTGYHSNISINLNPKFKLSDGEQVYIVIYRNIAETVDDNFDIAEDTPVVLNGKTVQLSLKIKISLTNN